MRAFVAEAFVRVVGPLHSLWMRFWAYGPWGPLHQINILIFKKIFGIEWPQTDQFKSLGEFFLRDVPFTLSEANLVSPAQARLVDGPLKTTAQPHTQVKGLSYQWDQMTELGAIPASTVYWNFYLAPHDYHWVHSPCAGSNLKAYRVRGKRWPVNALGRWLCPNLYRDNDRIVFRWDHPDFGVVTMICVGAMGVSSLVSVKGEVRAGQWVNLAPRIEKGEKILAFELGSTVLLLVERPPPSLRSLNLVNVGDAL